MRPSALSQAEAGRVDKSSWSSDSGSSSPLTPREGRDRSPFPPFSTHKESTDLDERDIAFLHHLRHSSHSSKPSSNSATTIFASSALTRRYAAVCLVPLLILTVWLFGRSKDSILVSTPHLAGAMGTRYDLRANAFSPALPKEIAENLHLTHAQCDAAFPLLWPQIMAAKKRQLAEGKIKEKQVQDPREGARVAIIDQNLYVKSFAPFGTRTASNLAAINEALLSAPEPLPNVEFFFHPLDIGYPGPIMETVSPDPGGAGWLIPDFGFYSWPEPILTGYKGIRRNAARVEKEISWKEKIPKLLWRGAFLSDVRHELREVASHYNESWADVGDINWGHAGEGSIPLWDHCRHKFLVHAEGFLGAYSGRMKYLLNCASVIVTHHLHWTQHFHPALDSDPTSPNQNIVVLPGEGWAELPAMMETLLKDDKKARRIAENAQRTLAGRYLTPASLACYWRRLFKEYAETLDFEPKIGNGKDYESFMLMGKVEWDPS